MPRRRLLLLLASAASFVAAALCAPPFALAHGLIGKQDLPIPRWLFAWGAAVVLVVSFVGLAVLWPKPTLQVPKPGKVILRVPRVLEPIAGLLGILAFGYTVYAGFAGAQDQTANLEPTVIYVLFWVGFPFASMIFGDVFAAFNPWRALARGVGWAGRRVGARAPEPLPWPTWLGRWPAVAGIFAFAWLELVYVDRDDPSKLSVLALLYAAVQLIGMSLYGVQRWSERGDGFGVYFNLFSRVAPLHWTEFRLERRRPLEGLPTLEVLPGTVALLCTMIGSTSFDGLSSGPTWTKQEPHLQKFFASTLGFSQEVSIQLAFSLGLIVTILVIGGLYRLGIAGMRTVDRKRSAGELSGSFAHTLVPIALAYVVAHYFSLLAYNGQAIAYLASDPLGNGSDFFGTANNAINYNWVSATEIWYVQVGALVIGHAAGLTLAHDRALATYRKARDATRSQYWMLAVMVGFTSLALWLLSSKA